MSTTINGVTVRIGRDSENLVRYVVTVQVASRVRKGLKSTNEIDPGAAGNQRTLLHQLGIAGAACAEYLGEKYGDNIDPAQVARDALRAFGEEARLIAAIKEQVPAKLKRLEQNLHVLKENQRELLHRCSYAVKKGSALTPEEVAALDVMIGQIHGSKL